MADIASLPGGNSPWRSAGRFGLYFLLISFGAYYILPLIVVLSTSFKDLDEIRNGTLLSLPAEINLESWRYAWSEACIGVSCTGLKPYFWNSVMMTIPAVLISTVLGALTGYALTKFKFRGANMVFAMILFGCFIPFQVVLLPMAQSLGFLGLANTVPGLVLVHIVYGLPFTVLFFRNYYVSIPDDLIKAATIDGAGFFTIFWRILLPLSPPIIVVTIIWQFTQIWNDFLFGASFTTGGGQPVTVALNNLVNTTTGVKRYNVDMAAALITAAPTLAVYVLAGRYFVRGLTAGSVKG
ncbi:carbohydrate ABC transporter permease [Kiloniella laminariae]|uniref:Carbohydrate ABC transporter permease n=1 Tax=Kiloniella laminariae TaxID=454162 RepID=A0ABT4LNK3_9PROT|nr:carbohydrate ABC transporter permease [Kiloniella laminariae]MCZ4282727.1 carbohydrate ABC transporter permease [Kiloniella laminariae]